MMVDSIVPVAGYRRWPVPLRVNLSDCPLRTRSQEWPAIDGKALPLKATCSPSVDNRTCCKGERVPNKACECGVYLFHDLARALPYRPMRWYDSVCGSAIGWGRALFDDEWARFEYALPIAFADPRDTETGFYAPRADATFRWLRNVSMAYGIPILPLSMLEEYTLEYGGTWKVPAHKKEEVG